jgi:hypothetical protein
MNETENGRACLRRSIKSFIKHLKITKSPPLPPNKNMIWTRIVVAV